MSQPENQQISEEFLAKRQFMKKKFPTRESMYNYLEDKGYFLAPFKNHGLTLRCWTEEYLWNLILGKSFVIKRDEIKVPPRMKKNSFKRRFNQRSGEISGSSN